MLEIYMAIPSFELKDYMDTRYNAISSVEYVDKIYPDIFLPECGFEIKEFWKFDPEYVPHLYISEKMKPVFEEYFADSGYFVGEVLECYPRPQVGKVIRGYYKWVIKNVVKCSKNDQRNQKYYTSLLVKYDIFVIYMGESLIFKGCGFSSSAIQILLDKGLWDGRFYKYEIHLEGEDDE